MRDHHLSVMAVFSRLVREYMRDAPPTVDPALSCKDVLRIMREFPASVIVIATHEGRPIGILTEQDVVRRITFLNPASTHVAAVMTSPLKIIHDEDYIFHGIAIMQKFGLSQLPVIDRSGRLTGILSLHDALTSSNTHIMDLIERLMHDETSEGLKLVKEAEVEIAYTLLKDQIPATEIQRLLTQINNDIYRRVQDIVLRELIDEGWGEPPVEFGMIVMGSGGRGESFLFPDQDNGFILTDYPDRQHTTIDSYFIRVAERMSVMLDDVGIPRCGGYVMAINPAWRKSLSQWYRQINSWLENPNRITLRYVDIFFDFQHVSGREDFVMLLRRYVTGAIKQNHVFLREMQLVQQDHGVALSKFGRLIPEKDSRHKGKINLKYQGLLPLVEAVRLLALREGINETSTLERIEALQDLAVLSHDERDSLGNAIQHLTTLILRQQVQDFKDGLQVSSYVSPETLPVREKSALTDSLRAIKELRGRVHTEFTGDVF
jgi:signal-transduction protein with cAMP-binding, CBS, and nucleotidyltransferase domain